MDRAAAQGRIVLQALDPLLLQLLVLRGEVAGGGFAFLGGFGAFQDNLFAHGSKGVGSGRSYPGRWAGQASK